MDYDERKFRELIVYISMRSEDDKRFGAVKLNKLLYYSDFRAYSSLGQSISGATYQHLQEGPAPRELLQVRESMAGVDVILESRPYFGGTIQERVAPKRPPDLSVFSLEELRIVDDVLAEFLNMNARQISKYSHEEYGWKLTEEGETIPYASAYFSAEPLTETQIKRGQEVARRHELQT